MGQTATGPRFETDAKVTELLAQPGQQSFGIKTVVVVVLEEQFDPVSTCLDPVPGQQRAQHAFLVDEPVPDRPQLGLRRCDCIELAVTAVQGESERIDHPGLVQAQQFACGGGRGKNPEIADGKPAVVDAEPTGRGRGQARAQVAAQRNRGDQLPAADIAQAFGNGKSRRNRLRRRMMTQLVYGVVVVQDVCERAVEIGRHDGGPFLPEPDHRRPARAALFRHDFRQAFAGLIQAGGRHHDAERVQNAELRFFPNICRDAVVVRPRDGPRYRLSQLQRSLPFSPVSRPRRSPPGPTRTHPAAYRRAAVRHANR